MVMLTLSWAVCAETGQLPQVVNLSYDTYAGPFYIMSATVNIELEERDYRIAASTKTEGFAAWMFSWRSQVFTEGRRDGNTLIPVRHQIQSYWQDSNRLLRLRYDDNRAIIEAMAPQHDPSKRDLVAEFLRNDTVDPLTMIAQHFLKMAQGDSSGGHYRIFDGRRRYDINIVHCVTDELEKNISAVYRGAAQACALQLDRIAGFWKKKTRVGQGLLKPTLWMASPLENVPAIPVKFEAESSYGSFRIHLTRVEIDGKMREIAKD